MILVLGSLAEPMIGTVFDTLRSRGRLVVHVSPSDLPAAVRLEVALPGHDARLLRSDGVVLSLQQVGAIYQRVGFVDFQQITGYTPTEAQFVNSECLAALNPLLNLVPCLVVNRPHAVTAAACRPWQLSRIEQAGLRVPETIVTNDPLQVEDFIERHGRKVVYKSNSPMRLNNLGEIPARAVWPVLLQQRVPGTDVRVHVVGERTFASLWRDSPDTLPAQPGLSAQLDLQCRQAVAALGLSLACLHLRVDDNGEAWCLGVDPSPPFSRYESRTRQPITAALCDLLENAERHGTGG